jgi:hypothetical protein
MPERIICPHCDSPHVEQLPRPLYAESVVTWYECLACHRLWNLPNDLPVRRSDNPVRRSDNDGSV